MRDFFDFDPERGWEERPPRRVLAVLAGEERPDEGPALRHFEAIDAEFVLEQAYGYAWSAPEGMPLSVLEYEARQGDPHLLATAPEGVVLDIRFDDALRDVALRQYFNLFGAAALRGVAHAVPVDAGTGRRILASPPEDAFPSASEHRIEEALARTDAHADMAAIYDVGQGSCSAILEASANPCLYFDFGGGVLQNTRTYPDALRHLCMTRKPTIIMSHWDWDHWSSAMRSQGAALAANLEGTTWIVPRQKIGPVHKAFLMRLIAGGARVEFWDDSKTSITYNAIEIAKCQGASRNDSGLAMRYRPDWCTHDGVFFTGDCAYSALPQSFAGARADALVVSHHGGLSGGSPPLAPASPNAPWYLSYGAGNSYDHPKRSALSAHWSAGWSPANLRDTTHRQPHPLGDLGHILVAAPGIHGPISGTPPCGGTCQLPIVQ